MISVVVDVVLLDVGGVLLLPDPEVILRALRRYGYGQTPPLEHAHYLATAAMDGAGILDPGAYFENYARACGVVESHVSEIGQSLAEVLTAESWTSVVAGAVSAMRRLEESGKRIGIVSNSGGTVARMLADAGICQVGDGVGVSVEVIIDSGIVGFRKPDPRIFEIAMTRLCVSPESVIHVGDTLTADVHGALAAGVRPVHLDPLECCALRDDHRHARDLNDVLDRVLAHDW